jgi:hypothetical protein
LKEEFRLRVFENRVLRRIFGTKKDDVTGEWRRLHNKVALCSVLLTRYTSGAQFKKTEMGKTCSPCGERRGAYRFFSGKI